MEDKLVMDFKYGDIILDCPQCGTRTILAENLVDGRAIYLFQRHDSYVRLECPNCKIALEMRMIESTNPPIEEDPLKRADVFLDDADSSDEGVMCEEDRDFINVESSNENNEQIIMEDYISKNPITQDEAYENIENEELQENITEEKTV